MTVDLDLGSQREMKSIRSKEESQLAEGALDRFR